MKRILLSCGMLMAVAAGCSSSAVSDFGLPDAGHDAAAHPIPDQGNEPDEDGNLDASATRDARPPTIGKDAGVVHKDAGVGNTDAGNTDASVTVGSTCTPAPIAGFAAVWHPPRRVAGACTASQVQAIVDCVLDDTSNPTTCKAVTSDPANKPCMDCAFSESTDSTYGPVIMGNGLVTTNYAGCVALKTGNITATGCGAKYQTLGQCTEQSCPCAVTDDASFAAYQKCTAKAEATTCASYAQDANCVDALTQPGAAAADCDLSTGSFIDGAKAYTTMFCQ